jgi:phage protein D
MAVEHAVQASVTVDGQELARRLRPYVEQIVVDDHLHLPDTFTITLLDPRRDILEQAGLRIGARVEISGTALGQQEEASLIHAEVTALEADYDAFGARIVVRGYDLSHRLHRGRRTRTFVNVSDSDIARKIAEDAGIEAGDIEPTTETYEHVSQTNFSDWEFLTERARKIGYEVAVRDGRFDFRRPEESSAAPAEGNLRSTNARQFVFGHDRGLLEFHPHVTAAEQVAKVEVRGWDRERKDAVVASVAAGTVSAQLSGTSPASLASLFGDPSFAADAGEIGTQNEAEAVAMAIAERIGSAFAEADGIARGDPELKAGAAVSVAGVADAFAGQYVLSHTRHVFDHDGYRTHFEISGRHHRSLLGLAGGTAARSLKDGRPERLGLVTALVSANDDPRKLGRVKVRYPWLSDDYESGWARVAQFEAASNTGASFIPEVDDEVLVGFEHGDIDYPVILGGLYNGVDKPRQSIPDAFDHGKVKYRGFVSRDQHGLLFFDGRGSGASGVLLVTGGGHLSVTLNEKDKVLTISGDPKVVIEAYRELDITSKGDLKISAQGDLTIKASGKLAIKSDSVVDIDGSQIQLN